MVSLDQLGRHRHRLPDIREALASDAVDGKLAGLRRPHVHAGEIADRVVVLRVAQPTQRHRPGIAGPRSRLGIERRRDPVQQLFPLRLIQLRRILRRHVAAAHPFGDVTERLWPSQDRLGGSKHREIEIVIPGHLPMTLPARFDKQRLNLFLE